MLPSVQNLNQCISFNILGWLVCVYYSSPAPYCQPFPTKKCKKIPPPEFRQAGQSILACYRILFHITHQTGQSQADLRHIGDQHQHSKNRGKIGDQLFEHRFDLDAADLTADKQRGADRRGDGADAQVENQHDAKMDGVHTQSLAG